MSLIPETSRIDVDAELVGRLIAAQFPRWAGLPVSPVSSAGTDNALYRLGADKVVRLPRVDWAIGQVEREHRWLPTLAPRLPMAIPAPLALGAPGEGYASHWSVCPWLEGEDGVAASFAEPEAAAKRLAAFIAALQAIGTADGPRAGRGNNGRGVPLAYLDNRVRGAVAELGGEIEVELALAAWTAAVEAPAWTLPGVWLHGDLHPGNLLIDRGQLSAVIDFGCLGIGDPACDAMAAWTVFRGEARAAFRAALSLDAATWTRARGWALYSGLIALPYYLHTNPVIVSHARRLIAEVLADA